MKHRFIGSGVMRPTEEIHLSREYIARDPRTGLPIAVAKQRKSKKKVKAETGPWVALSDEDVEHFFRPFFEIERLQFTDLTEEEDRELSRCSLSVFMLKRV